MDNSDFWIIIIMQSLSFKVDSSKAVKSSSESIYLENVCSQKRSWNNCNKVLVIQRRKGRVVTDYKNRQKVCLVHYN